jgi:hypothetical protein
LVDLLVRYSQTGQLKIFFCTKRVKIDENFFKPVQNEAQVVNGFGSNGRKYVDRLSYYEGPPKK